MAPLALLRLLMLQPAVLVEALWRQNSLLLVLLNFAATTIGCNCLVRAARDVAECKRAQTSRAPILELHK